MLLPALATADDLADYMQTALAPAAADRALRTASATIRRWLRQDITRVDGDTVILPGLDRVLVLPQRPVVVDDTHLLTVTELADGGGIDYDTVENRDFTRIGAELTRGHPWYPPGRLMGWPHTRVHGVWAPRVRVTYSHGHSQVPDDLVGICLDLAAATVANPNRLRSETVGAMTLTYTVETFGTGSLTDAHREILRRYKRTAFSVAPR